MLPNLIILGAMKCGSTSLHHYLSFHPDIHMSLKKELDFFIEEKHWCKGVSWYETNFSKDSKINGESSQNYSKTHIFKNIPEKMATVLPDDCKYIFIVRDPIKRIISQIRENIAGKNETERYKEKFNGNLESNHYVKCSMYYSEILPYIEQFGVERIHFLTLEDLSDNPVEELNRIFDFLNLTPCPLKPEMFQVHNSGKEKRRQNSLGKLIFSDFLLYIYRAILSNQLRNRISKSKLFKKLTSTKVSKVDLDSSVIKEIKLVIKEDLLKFSSVSGVNIKKWEL